MKQLKLALYATSILLLSLTAISAVAKEPGQILFDFETGDLAKEGWIITEGENSRPIGCRDSIFHTQGPYPKQGKYYLTTLESEAGPKTYESNCCVMESPVFRLTDGSFRFMIGGGNISASWLALCQLKENGDFVEIKQFRGTNHQTMETVTLDLSDRKGQPLFFRLVDSGTGAWSYLHADNFSGKGTIDEKATLHRRHSILKAEFIQQKKPAAEMLNVTIQHLNDLLSESEENTSEKSTIDSMLKDAQKLRAELEKLQPESVTTADFSVRWKVLRDQISQLNKKVVFLDSPLMDSPILYVSRPVFPYEHHNTETTYQTDDICTHMFPTGSALRVWDTKSGKSHTLLDVPNGIVRDPCLHFDGKRILFSLRNDINDDFHLYELNLTDRDPMTAVFQLKDLRQLTFGKGLSDIDPQYLPDGRIVFSSSREPKYCMCNRHIMCNLFTMNGDGSNLLQIGHSTLYEGHSSLLPDGRILYYRWEYVDRNFSDAQGVWVTNPDGTNHALFWGNNTESPATTINPRIMPDSNSVFVCTMTACHTPAWGAIALIDRTKGLDGKEPVLQVWPEEAWNLIGTYTGSSYDSLMRLKQFFEDPWPLDSQYIIATGTIPKGTLLPPSTVQGQKPGVTGLWLLDRQGGMQLVFTDPVGCFDPIPLAPSEAPPVITDRIDLAQKNGSFYVTNVYEGFGMTNVPKGTVKYLRVIESPEKRFWVRPSWVGVDRKGDQQAPAMNWDDFGNKRILGTVPVEEDGSVYFSVPADTFVFFQLLDEKRQMIQSMRSGVIVRPGETNGCYGCHEDRLETPVSTHVTAAMRKKPLSLEHEFGRAPFLFSYMDSVQPIFDKYCVTCHDFPSNTSTPLAQQAAKKLLLCGDRNTVFNCSYWELRNKKYVNVIGGAYAEKIKPLFWGSGKSRLMEIMRNGHDNGGPIDQARAKCGCGSVDQAAIDMTAAWIDMNAPYYGEYSSNYPSNPYGRSPLTSQEMEELAKLTGRTKLRNEMAGYQRPEPILDHDISFDRPEMSPCLDRWPTPTAKKSAEYQRALTLIRTGSDRLKAVPRADMPNWKILNPVELRRQAKYDVFLKKSENMKNAVLRGEKLYDRDNQLSFEECKQ